MKREPLRLLVRAKLRFLLGCQLERPRWDLGPELPRSLYRFAPTAQLFDLHRARLDLNNCSVNGPKGTDRKVEQLRGDGRGPESEQANEQQEERWSMRRGDQLCDRHEIGEPVA